MECNLGRFYHLYLSLPFFHLFFYYNLGLVGPCASASTSSRVASARTNREIVLIEAQGRRAQYRCAAAAQILWELEKWRQKPAQEDSRAFQRLSHCSQAPGGYVQVTWSHKRVQKKMIYHLLIESDNIRSNIVQLVLSVLLLLFCGFSFLFFILTLLLPFWTHLTEELTSSREIVMNLRTRRLTEEATAESPHSRKQKLPWKQG